MLTALLTRWVGCCLHNIRARTCHYLVSQTNTVGACVFTCYDASKMRRFDNYMWLWCITFAGICQYQACGVPIWVVYCIALFYGSCDYKTYTPFYLRFLIIIILYFHSLKSQTYTHIFTHYIYCIMLTLLFSPYGSVGLQYMRAISREVQQWCMNQFRFRISSNSIQQFFVSLSWTWI